MLILSFERAKKDNCRFAAAEDHRSTRGGDNRQLDFCPAKKGAQVISTLEEERQI